MAAEALRISANDLLELKLIDEIIPEPEGGAHVDYEAAARFLDNALVNSLRDFSRLSAQELVARRYEKFRRMGQFFA